MSRRTLDADKTHSTMAREQFHPESSAMWLAAFDKQLVNSVN
jgi:hypothetical protein